MVTPNFPRKLFSFALFSILLILTSACSGSPKYSGEAGDFRFYVLQAQKVNQLTSWEGKPISTDPGFVFLVVDLAVENKSSQTVFGMIGSASVNGRTSSGDYKYDETSYAAFNGASRFGPIPRGSRFKISKAFQVATAAGDYRITLNLYGGLFGGPSTTIALPAIGEHNTLAFPYDPNGKPTYLNKIGHSISWFGNTSAVLERIDRTPDYLNVQVKINNTTGYVMSQQNPWVNWWIVVMGTDGSLAFVDYNADETINPSFTLPPGESVSVVYKIMIKTPDSLKGAILSMQGSDGTDGKSVVYDLSDVQ